MKIGVPYTVGILASVLVHVWILEERWPRGAVLVPAAIIVGLTLLHDYRRREWGFSSRALWPGMQASLIVTVLLVLVILGAGMAMGTLHDRRDFLGSLAPLVLWGGAQQWVLQTVVLRESQRMSSARTGIVIAALLFGAVHLPNPFLAPVTAGAALVWCALYDRYPNVLPLALSHGLGTLALRYAFTDEMIGRLRIGASYLRLDQ